MERIEQSKKAKGKKRSHPPNGRELEPLLKRPKSRGDLISNTPSPLTLNSSRPGSVLSTASTFDATNGDDSLDFQGSTDGSEVNSEISGPGTTPVRKPAKSRIGALKEAGGNRKPKRTSAPLGGRGKMQKSGKKTSGSAAASAGAIAGAKAASNAAYAAAYGIAAHHISPSPSSSPGVLAPTHGGSTHSSPRVSPVPMAFVATSLVTTPPSNKSTSKAPSSLTYAKSNLQ